MEAEPAPVVLVVDDSSLTRRTILRMLRLKGYRGLEASDGTEALRWLDSQQVDIVLLDYFMPELDGGRVLDHIRRAEGRSVPVVLMSGASPVELDALLALMPDALLPKPFDHRTLLATLDRLLTRPTDRPASIRLTSSH